jgi:2-hydroxycyclohexanecarboxyl-CoA dehydrogenase
MVLTQMRAQVKNNKFIDKVAIITGGGSGIGAATARLFAKEGAKVVVTDIDKAAAERVAKEIENKGEQAVAARVDVTCNDEIKKTVQDVLARWGKIDILVNCAGTGDIGWFIQSNEETWDRILTVNLKGTMSFTHAVLPSMVERKYGKIINIASIAGKVGAMMQVAYSASKAGVSGFTKALAREVARHGINVNDICPGPIDTPLYGLIASMDPELQKKYVQGVAQRRIGKPEEVAAAALFLASDECEFITGHSLVVDGGSTMI